MKNHSHSIVTRIGLGETGVAMLINGTTDSSFTLMRGVPSNQDKKLSEYLWAEVLEGGKPVTLSLSGDNPLVIKVPGTYRFLNNGTDDESAIIDMTVYSED